MKDTELIENSRAAHQLLNLLQQTATNAGGAWVISPATRNIFMRIIEEHIGKARKRDEKSPVRRRAEQDVIEAAINYAGAQNQSFFMMAGSARDEALRELIAKTHFLSGVIATENQSKPEETLDRGAKIQIKAGAQVPEQWARSTSDTPFRGDEPKDTSSEDKGTSYNRGIEGLKHEVDNQPRNT